MSVGFQNEETKEALTFIVRYKEAETAPPWHYMKEILRGGESCCSEKYLSDLRERYSYIKG
ncbi:hypothetical protein [Lentibacillus sp. JNUCC-1]|uniref:hypothetical protein n=1 Tax=Lentibacillus sp. JNUCC-1 TaxID=2654513 RepID=UPI003FA53BEF